MTPISTPQPPLSPDTTEASGKRKNLIELWHSWTALPDLPDTAPAAERERVRKSRLTSNVLFYFSFMVLMLIPACFLAPYPWYGPIDSALFLCCIVGLFLNKIGNVVLCGMLVTFAGFAALTLCLFATIPFDATTLQGYDMYVIVELLAVSLLSVRSVILYFLASVACILYTTFAVTHTPELQQDLHDRLIIVLARPLGLLLLVGGVAIILVLTLERARKDADQAEELAQIQEARAREKEELQEGIALIVNTHVAIANGDLYAEAPLTKNNDLWKISNALNNMLVRYRALAKEANAARNAMSAVAYYVKLIQEAQEHKTLPLLPLGKTLVDPLIAALQGQKIGVAPPPSRTHNGGAYLSQTPKPQEDHLPSHPYSGS